MCYVVSDLCVAWLIILLDLKRFTRKLPSIISTYFPYFIFEKAYDTTWKYWTMKDLHRFDPRGCLPDFINNVLKDRYVKLRVGSTFSDSYLQEMGVPHGNIMSVI